MVAGGLQPPVDRREKAPCRIATKEPHLSRPNFSKTVLRNQPPRSTQIHLQILSAEGVTSFSHGQRPGSPRTAYGGLKGRDTCHAGSRARKAAPLRLLYRAPVEDPALQRRRSDIPHPGQRPGYPRTAYGGVKGRDTCHAGSRARKLLPWAPSIEATGQGITIPQSTSLLQHASHVPSQPHLSRMKSGSTHSFAIPRTLIFSGSQP